MDAYYERGLKLWDEAAGRLLVTEAGGALADLDGEPHGVVAAATPELSEELMPCRGLGPGAYGSSEAGPPRWGI